MTVQVADPLSGVKLGDYVIEAAIGHGGMGIVYRAVHPLIGRKVAVKVLRPEMASDPEQASRFLKEAQALSAVKHRGIIDIISFGHLPDGRQYMVMEFLEGEALDELGHREGRLSPVRALTLVDEVLDALSAAHKAGVVHRDIKPSNVFLLEQSNGTRVVKVVDFGLARLSTPAALARRGERSSLMAGTPEYLAPEQAKGLAATPATDLYAVGVMLFELLTGRLPFEDEGVIPLLDAHVKRPPPHVADLVDGLPQSLDALVDALLAKDPADRPGSADVVRGTIQRVLRELRTQETQIAAAPVAYRKPATPRAADTRPAPPPTDRVAGSAPRPKVLAFVAVLAVAGLAGGAYVWNTTRAEAPAPVPPLVVDPPRADTTPTSDQVPAADPAGAHPSPATLVQTPPGSTATAAHEGGEDELTPLPTRRAPAPRPAGPAWCRQPSWRTELKKRLGDPRPSCSGATATLPRRRRDCLSCTRRPGGNSPAVRSSPRSWTKRARRRCADACHFLSV